MLNNPSTNPIVLVSHTGLFLHPICTKGGQICPLSKNCLESDNSYFLLNFLKYIFWGCDVTKTMTSSKPSNPYTSKQICLNVAKYYFQFGLLLFWRHLWWSHRRWWRHMHEDFFSCLFQETAEKAIVLNYDVINDIIMMQCIYQEIKYFIPAKGKHRQWIRNTMNRITALISMQCAQNYMELLRCLWQRQKWRHFRWSGWPQTFWKCVLLNLIQSQCALKQNFFSA